MRQTDKIRNIGVIAHIDAGKTTLSERILYYCQKIHRLGEVHDGAATMDFMPEEQERGITIASACSTCQWDGATINLVDTPGHVDFTIEVERALRVMDGAVGVFCAVSGVEPQSETVWRQSENFAIPKLAFVNKMDRVGANFEAALASMRERLGANPAPVFAPAGEGDGFCGIYDLINEKKLVFNEADQGRTWETLEITEEEKPTVEKWRARTLENLAEADDEFLSIWLERIPDKKEINAAMRRATLNRKITPVFCGSALRNAGVQPLLDGIKAWLPSPEDAAPPLGILPDGRKVKVVPDPKKPPVALVFKILVENGRKNCFVRLYQGIIREGEQLYDASDGKVDRVARLYRMHADRREALTEIYPGDIAMITGLRAAKTGDTYGSAKEPVSLEAIRAYDPVITLALEPKNSDEAKILDEALDRFLEEDPTLRLERDEENGSRALSGMGELHLEIILERIRREYKIEPRSGAPKVIMRETPGSEGEGRAVFDREFGKERHRGDVSVRVCPRERNSGNRVIVGDFLPADEKEARKIFPDVYLQAVLEGVNDSLQSGILAGWPVTDAEVTITGAVREEGATTAPGLRMAAAQALRDATRAANPTLLEPLMRVEITTPEEYLGAVIGLFNQLGGKIDAAEDNAGAKLVSGLAPLRNLFGFSTKLRSASQGRAAFTMTFQTFDVA